MQTKQILYILILNNITLILLILNKCLVFSVQQNSYLHSNFSELQDWNTIDNSCTKISRYFATDLSHSRVPANGTSKRNICRK